MYSTLGSPLSEEIAQEKRPELGVRGAFFIYDIHIIVLRYP